MRDVHVGNLIKSVIMKIMHAVQLPDRLETKNDLLKQWIGRAA